MVHRIYPILGGLALGLISLAPQPAAAARSGNAGEYNGLAASGLALRGAQKASGAARLLTAQAAAPNGRENGPDARKKLKEELDRIRRKTPNEAASSSFDPPMPVRRKTGPAAIELAEGGGAARAQQGDPQIGRLLSQLLLMRFKGSQPSDAGPKAIRSLLESELIAGVAFSRENIQSRSQIKGLLKFLAAGARTRPIFAIREIGGASDPFPQVKEFERWPPQSDVAAKGDPQYAYSTYQSMGASLAALGFNMNFGPVLATAGENRDPGANFGGDPLQAGVFAKTFILGHREENVIAVPQVDSEGASIRPLKTLLVSDPGLPVGLPLAPGGGTAPFSAYEGLVNGARFCFAALAGAAGASEAVSGFKGGCDVLVVDGGAESPAAVRQQLAESLSRAVQNGEVTLDMLNAARERFGKIRSQPHEGLAAAGARPR